ncbi:hypothetical protein [Legionella clemsonensis]|uniref:Uncharacterized protein n=1 Tax=Legionella clemsonensis TaxID=1867846 RepID=A0A222P3R4_9GAMM|nr:hypothetical protein [Legionella clemsonensis]ASQ46500.1 hypothetical protein clem_09750 [Legionella clemsonensis]
MYIKRLLNIKWLNNLTTLEDCFLLKKKGGTLKQQKHYGYRLDSAIKRLNMTVKKSEITIRRVINKRISSVKLAEKRIQLSTVGEGKGIVAFGFFRDRGNGNLNESKRALSDAGVISPAIN